MEDIVIGIRKDIIDTICEFIDEYLRTEEYSINTGIEIIFEPDPLMRIDCLQNLGYDMNDDGSTYFDADGRPYISEQSTSHWIEDITQLDANGKRTANVDYICKLVVENIKY